MSEANAQPTTYVSPLVEIEQRALEIANERNIGLDQDNTDEQLRVIITEVVEQWRADFLRGIRPVDLGEPQMIIERAMSNLVGHGPLAALLDDDDVWEIMLNAPDQIFVKRHKGPSGYHHESFHAVSYTHLRAHETLR